MDFTDNENSIDSDVKYEESDGSNYEGEIDAYDYENDYENNGPDDGDENCGGDFGYENNGPDGGDVSLVFNGCDFIDESNGPDDNVNQTIQ